MSELTHFDSEGNAIMVDVSEKPVTTRIAVATGKIYVCQEIFERIQRLLRSRKVRLTDVQLVYLNAPILGLIGQWGQFPDR